MWGDSEWGGAAWGEESGVTLSANEQLCGCANLTASIMLVLVAVTQIAACENVQANVRLSQTLTASEQVAGCANLSGTISQNHKLTAINQIAGCENTPASISISHILTTTAQVAECANLSTNITQNHVLSSFAQVASCKQFASNVNYLAINYALDNKSVTTYSDFNFTGSCRFAGKTLFINDKGLFEHGGLTDNGAAIVPSLKTGKMDMVAGKDGARHSNKIKRSFDSRLLISCDKKGGEVDVSVTTDENLIPFPYANAIVHDDFATHGIKLGKGLRYNRIQLNVTANGCSKLNIESIELNQLESRRSER